MRRVITACILAALLLLVTNHVAPNSVNQQTAGFIARVAAHPTGPCPTITRDVPPILRLGRELSPPRLTAAHAAAIARRDGGFGVLPHSIAVYGSWADPGLSYYDGRYSGGRIDAWEIRVSGVPLASPGGDPFYFRQCQPPVFHHLAIIVSDRTGRYIEATGY